MKACIIVISNKCFNKEKEDSSGEILKKYLIKNGFSVEGKIIVPSQKEMIEEAIKHCTDNLKVPLVLTVGSVGFAKDDIAPEATKNLIEKKVNGICEVIRMKSLEISDKEMLNRAIAGLRNNSLIVNLTSNEKLINIAMDTILTAVKHGLNILLGEETECGRSL